MPMQSGGVQTRLGRQRHLLLGECAHPDRPTHHDGIVTGAHTSSLESLMTSAEAPESPRRWPAQRHKLLTSGGEVPQINSLLTTICSLAISYCGTIAHSLVSPPSVMFVAIASWGIKA
jgi:hypothetical protein